ncbi:MAG: endonuclease/exonuclease/phosphatase family protein [Amphritea sp.]|nr:endonuclease/exonuclease/phosphatase family protein [Amphritea sp.]
MHHRLTLLSWNIQNCRGCDGSIQPQRIIDYIRQLPEQPEVICLQEVARFFPEYCDPQQPDQLACFTDAFPEYHISWGAALSWPGDTPQQRREFGNLTLSKLPLLDQRLHSLPVAGSPSGNAWQTPRIAVETWVRVDAIPVAIINTHLAYHCQNERLQQLKRLNQIRDQHTALCAQPPLSGAGIYLQPERPALMLLCGDLNCCDQSDHYTLMLEAGWKDAALSNAQTEPTCGLFDREQWPQGPHRRDYIFMSETQPASVSVDQHCNASDHQPMFISMELNNE